MAKPSSNRARKPATAAHPKAAPRDRRRPDPRAQRKPAPVSGESEPSPALWPIQYLCYVCMRNGRRERATLRIFSGGPQDAGMSGGWPACDAHHGQALVDAFRPLDLASRWAVSAFRVHDLDGEPSMDHAPLWVAGG